MAVTADQYLPVHVTEVDEARWDDCRVCSAYMLVQLWTFGEIIQKKNGEFLTSSAIKKFREKMRDYLPLDKQQGGLGPADTKLMIAKAWPWLPPVNQPRPKFSELWDRLGRNYAYSVSGNPAEVKLPASKLRKWTVNDNFGHEIVAVRTNAAKDKVLIFDPLAPRWVGGKKYKGDWVPKAQFKQFLYLKDGVVLYCSQVKIGSQSKAARTARQKNAEIVKIETANQQKVTKLRGQIGDLQKQLVPVDEAYERGRQEAYEEVSVWVDEIIEDLEEGPPLDA